MPLRAGRLEVTDHSSLTTGLVPHDLDGRERLGQPLTVRAARPDQPLELAAQSAVQALGKADSDARGNPRLRRDARIAHRQREDWEVDVAVEVADYAWLESRAWKVETFQDNVVPGLLQTPDYARAVLRALDPAANAGWIEQTLAARLARQQRLTGEDPLQFSAIVDEMALRRAIGPPELMRAQLKHIAELSGLANVEVRVLPFAAGAHASLPGPFTILRLPDEQDMATLGTLGPDIYLEDVEPFAKALRRLAKTALPQRKSVAMIGAIRRETT